MATNENSLWRVPRVPRVPVSPCLLVSLSPCLLVSLSPCLTLPSASRSSSLSTALIPHPCDHDMSGETQIPRFCPDRALPPYSYVPGVNAHPGSDPRGHSFGVPPEKAEPLSEESYRGNATYLYAIDLFNHGFYWEAHEAWEALWHAAGRQGATAAVVTG